MQRSKRQAGGTILMPFVGQKQKRRGSRARRSKNKKGKRTQHAAETTGNKARPFRSSIGPRDGCLYLELFDWYRIAMVPRVLTKSSSSLIGSFLQKIEITFRLPRGLPWVSTGWRKRRNDRKRTKENKITDDDFNGPFFFPFMCRVSTHFVSSSPSSSLVVLYIYPVDPNLYSRRKTNSVLERFVWGTNGIQELDRERKKCLYWFVFVMVLLFRVTSLMTYRMRWWHDHTYQFITITHNETLNKDNTKPD